jgi:hypothetical protein
MRTLTNHIVEGDSANHQLSITVLDEPGAGGANHRYEIARERYDEGDPSGTLQYRSGVVVSFQNGPIKEAGVNGVTHEALLAIVIDRLKSFQAGPFACESNQKALDYSMLALSFLQDRTRARIARGVEGTHAK